MVDEDSHLTELSVSGEERLSTISLAHFIFWSKLFSNFSYAAKLHKNA